MALVLKDRVQETTTSTGTGTITLDGAVTGYQTFSSAIGNGNTCYYAIALSTEWEVGIGTYTSSGNTLSRDTVLESSNAGSLVSFSAGTKSVFVTYPAEQGIYKDASGNAIALGTPASVNLTNATGLPLSTGVTGTLPIANGGTGSTSTTYVNLASNVTGTLPVANGGTGITSLGTGVATFLGTPSSSNLASAVTDETGSGSLVFATSPTLVTPALGTPSSGTLTSCTGLPLTTGVTGTLPVTNGGTGTATSFTTGSVVFAGASGVYSQNNAGFFWDNTNSRLGIGTAAPATRITINNNTALPSAGAITGTGLWQVGADATANILLLDAFNQVPFVVGRHSSGTSASPTATASGNTLLFLSGRGYGATGYSSGTRASIVFNANETWTDTAQGTRIRFDTTQNGTTTSTERMRIDDAGFVGINTTNPISRLDVVGSFISGRSSGTTGFGNVSATANDYSTSFRSTNLIQNDSATSGTTCGLSNANLGQLYFTNTSTGLIWTNGSTPLVFGTLSAERMRIDATGNILVAQAARGTVLTDNDLSFDMNASSNFKCTPTALGTLTFTNITSGQSGFILLVNTGGHAISAAATTEVSSTTLTTISTAGTYLLSYFSDGTNVFVTNSGALA